MIRTIAIQAGESAYAMAALEHALHMAKLFDSTLRIVGVWDDQHSDERELKMHQQMIERAVQHALKKAADAGVQAEETTRGDGVAKGMLEEAKECDLVVLGMPSRATAATDRGAKAIVKAKMPIVRRAESLVLVVCDKPSDSSRIMVYYAGGIAAKQALRVAGVVAEKTRATLLVLCVGHERAATAELAGTAKRYLGGFDLQKLRMLEKVSSSDTESDIVQTAEDENVNLVVCGAEPHGPFRIFGDTPAEHAAMDTCIPFLAAR